jgi:type I restriction enzyme S subunit
MATNRDSLLTATPQLRFPEFQGAWKHQAIGPHLEECGARVSAPTSLPIYTSSRSGLKPQEEYYGGRTIINEGEYGVVPPECFVFRHMSDDGRFTFHMNETGGEIAVSKEYPIFRAVDLNRHFLLATLNHSPDFKAFALSQKAGGTRTRLYFSKLRTWETLLPSLAEQQKIAECLMSLDELIAAQGRKVDALSAHKRGLMQRLFPREGETLPRLRFPEFQNAGEWVKKPFSDLCDIKHGYAFESEFFSNEGEYVLLTPGNFYEQGGYRDRGDQQKYYTGEIPRDYVLAQGDMLVAMTEQAAGLLGSPILVPQSEKFLHNQRLGLVIRKAGVAWENEFFFHVFNTQPVRKAIHEIASGTKVRHTSPTNIGEVAVYTPPSLSEQQSIAACLSSLDAAIAAESEHLAALKTHKKALMQQLFPTAEGAIA